MEQCPLLAKHESIFVEMIQSDSHISHLPKELKTNLQESI